MLTILVPPRRCSEKALLLCSCSCSCSITVVTAVLVGFGGDGRRRRILRVTFSPEDCFHWALRASIVTFFAGIYQANVSSPGRDPHVYNESKLGEFKGPCWVVYYTTFKQTSLHVQTLFDCNVDCLMLFQFNLARFVLCV